MASVPGHTAFSQALSGSMALEAHDCCPRKCGNCDQSAPLRTGLGIFCLDTDVFSVFANIPSTPNGDVDRPAAPVPPISPGFAEPKRSAPTPHRLVTPITPPQPSLAEPKWSATIHRPVTPENAKPSQTILEALKASAATRCWPSTFGQPILGQTLLAALKTSAAAKSWPAALGLPILGQTLLAALKSSSVARHWPVTLGQPIIAQPPPAKPKSSAPAHQPGIPTTTFPLRAATGSVPPRRSHLVGSAPKRCLQSRRKRTQVSNSDPPVRKTEDRRHVPPAPTEPAPWWSNYWGAITGPHAFDYSPSPGGARKLREEKNAGGRTSLPAGRAQSSSSSEDELNHKKLKGFGVV